MELDELFPLPERLRGLQRLGFSITKWTANLFPPERRRPVGVVAAVGRSPR
jgi:hypothetical protein